MSQKSIYNWLSIAIENRKYVVVETKLPTTERCIHIVNDKAWFYFCHHHFMIAFEESQVLAAII